VSLAWLLDTNAISEPLRPAPNGPLLRRIEENEGQIAIAAVVWHELLYGWRRLPESKRREAIERYLFEVVRPTMPILPYDAQAAQWHAAERTWHAAERTWHAAERTWHAAERARLAQAGRPPSFADGQIAAIAAAHGLTLVTANLSDFADFRGLKTVNWLEA